MRTLTSLALAGLVAAAAAPAPVAAQNPCRTMLAKSPTVGAWAEYGMKDGSMKMALVGAEKREGRSLIWMEMAFADKKGKGAITKMLVGGYPQGLDQVEEVVMKMEGQPAMKIPGSMINMMKGQMAKNPSDDFLRKCDEAEYLGVASVTVPAGTYSTHHFRDKKTGDEVWVNMDLPFPMVKATDKGGKGIMELTGSGRDAKSAITETPMEMPGMGGMPRN